MTGGAGTTRVVIVGGGFAGVGCARELVKQDGVQVTLIDRNEYHQFQPLLYQVATSMLAPGDIAYPLRQIAAKHGPFDVKLADATAIDAANRTVTTADGAAHSGDVLVIAAGSLPNFFGTPGAGEHAFPLYSVSDALRLRGRILALFEEADRDHSVIDEGALTFVIVGGGPTGVETAGALAELIKRVIPHEYPALPADAATVTLIDHGQALLSMFADKGHDYAKGALERDGVRLRFGAGVTEVGAGHVSLSDGTRIPTRCVIWGGGVKAARIAAATGITPGRGGRIDVDHDLSVPGMTGVFAIGDVANIPDSKGNAFPQLGSVAMQSGAWAGKNIRADIDGKARKPFHYLDKGTMAMIGRGAAVAQVKGVEIHGKLAFAGWLGVHAALMTGGQNRVDAFVAWAGDYFGGARGPQLLDRSDNPRIDWGEDAEDIGVAAGTTSGTRGA